MQRVGRYAPEYLLIAATMVISIAGFWDIYVGPEASPQPHHHLHLLTVFLWLGLLLIQLTLVNRGRTAEHRKWGVAVLFAGPLLVATTAMLSVHSAHKGWTSGEGDFLIVQNVMGTIELGLLIFLAFIFRRRRKLHGALLLSTTVLFMGIALFFALISFVPQFKIEGPETFYRFQTAAMTGQAICLAVGILFVIRDFRNGWPYLMAALFFLLNEMIRSWLTDANLIDPLTASVGSMNQPFSFVGVFLLLLVLLGTMVRPSARLAWSSGTPLRRPPA